MEIVFKEFLGREGNRILVYEIYEYIIDRYDLYFKDGIFSEF